MEGFNYEPWRHGGWYVTIAAIVGMLAAAAMLASR